MTQNLEVEEKSILPVKKGYKQHHGQGRKKVTAAFYILKQWFLYGIPKQEELYEMFNLSCLEQRREILVALRHHGESKLLESLSRSFEKK